MKKTFKYLCIVFALQGLLFTACAPKQLTVKREMAPDTSIKTDVEIDYEQLKSECEELLNQDEYPLSSYIDFAIHEDEKVIELIWVLNEDATQVESLEYGKAYIKAFNDVYKTQDFSIAASGPDYYGGLWDKYDLDLQVFKESYIIKPDMYFINQYMKAGSNDPVLPQIMSDVEAETEKE